MTFHTEQQVIDWISGQLKFGIRPGLERMEAALIKLGSPHLKLKTVHVGGTNGKGSTVTFLRSVLEAAGYKVGTFTSPFIESFGERISINDIPIIGSDLAQSANIIYPIIEEINQSEIGPFTEFEIITLLSFVHFDRVGVDMALYEVGLGGRHDSTNVIMPLVAGITNVGHDHQEILGDTLSKIAYEKIGIAKQGVPLFTTAEDKEVLATFREYAEIRLSLQENPLSNVQLNQFGATFDWADMPNVQITMKGLHQVKNATLAYSLLKELRHHFEISDEAIRTGMKRAFWKGRFEVVSNEPLIILDGAHNIEGVQSLVKTIQESLAGHRCVFMTSILKDKDYGEMFGEIAKVADEIHFTTFDFFRAQSGKAQFEAYPYPNASYNEDPLALLSQLKSSLAENDCLIVTGSLYFISEIRKYFF
ncbi:MAG: bifunctional folylpolyglutamate synthase/dihydrofolate synthase [Turicibacter sp.]|nr:bifunctional folylpolyglutamate synthase/dihydrofolate synthase [Turicibacter sp.]